MKYGVRIKIDVTKLDKSHFYHGKKGTYADLTVFMDTDNQGKYGDHGMITQDVGPDARERGEKGAIVGNVKVFWQGESDGQKQPGQIPAQPQQQAPDFDDDLPF